jgi:DNA-binding MarR family transcriptional regulator
MATSEKILNENEQKVLFALCKFPNDTDKELSQKFGLAESTFTTIRNRLAENLFKPYLVPMLNRIDGGAELMGVIFSNFSLVVPLEQRVNRSKRTIDEIFLSIGEPEKGYSLSISKNYTDFARINEIRTETFGRMGLLEGEFPHEIIFPFEISCIKNFFDFSELLKETFSIEGFDKDGDSVWFKNPELKRIKLTETEKKVFLTIIENPDATLNQIGEIIGISRQSVAKIKKDTLEKNDLIKRMVVPNLKKLGFKMFVFYRLKFSPQKPPSEQDLIFLDSNSSIFYAYRRFELVILAVYRDYNAYKEDKMKKLKYLKENNLITYNPIVRKFEYDRIEVIKDFNFAPITKKILQLD